MRRCVECGRLFPRSHSYLQNNHLRLSLVATPFSSSFIGLLLFLLLVGECISIVGNEPVLIDESSVLDLRKVSFMLANEATEVSSRSAEHTVLKPSSTCAKSNVEATTLAENPRAIHETSNQVEAVDFVIAGAEDTAVEGLWNLLRDLPGVLFEDSSTSGLTASGASSTSHPQTRPTHGKVSSSLLYDYDAPFQIYNSNPSTKIIFVLRDPVLRAYFAYHDYVKTQNISLDSHYTEIPSFEALVDEELPLLKSCLESRGLSVDDSYYSTIWDLISSMVSTDSPGSTSESSGTSSSSDAATQPKSQSQASSPSAANTYVICSSYTSPTSPLLTLLLKGTYLPFLQHWTSIFPSSQILVLRSEDIENTNDVGWDRTFGKIVRFLGLGRGWRHRERHQRNHPIHNHDSNMHNNHTQHLVSFAAYSSSSYASPITPTPIFQSPNVSSPMTPSIRYTLERFFDPLNKQLLQFIKSSGVRVCGVNERRMMEEADMSARSQQRLNDEVNARLDEKEEEEEEGAIEKEELVRWVYDVVMGI